MSNEPQAAAGKPFRMHVETGKVREFARATKSADPAYLEGEQPLSPTTFLASAMFWQDPESRAPGLPTDYSRLLHGEQEYVFFGEPPRAGTMLVGQARIDRVYEKEGRRGGTMRFMETVTDFRDTDGVLVAQARSTAIETSRPPSEAHA